MPSLVLPQGSLEKATLQLFDPPDLTVRRGPERAYHPPIPEATVPDIVDAIVDLTETGSSLRRNGLKIVHTLLTSSTELIANHDACADPAKRAAMDDVALLLRGAILARGNVLLKLNVADTDLSAVTTILPAMTSPTITPLPRGDLHAVEAVVPN